MTNETTKDKIIEAMERMEKECGFQFFLNQEGEVILESDTERVFMASLLTHMTLPHVPVTFYEK